MLEIIRQRVNRGGSILPWAYTTPSNAGGGCTLREKFGYNAIRAIYGFLAPTGRFSAGAHTNVGSGYWTSAVSSGQTIYLNTNKTTSLSAFQMYEFHNTQQGTMIHPGQTFNLDYSLTQSFPLQRSLRLQLGLAGYVSGRLPTNTGRTLLPHRQRHTTKSTLWVLQPTQRRPSGK